MDVNNHSLSSFKDITSGKLRRVKYDENWDFAASETPNGRKTLYQQHQEYKNKKKSSRNTASRGGRNSDVEGTDFEDTGFSENELQNEMIRIHVDDSGSISSRSGISSRGRSYQHKPKNKGVQDQRYRHHLSSDHDTEYKDTNTERGLADERVPVLYEEADHCDFSDAQSMYSSASAVRERRPIYSNSRRGSDIHTQPQHYAHSSKTGNHRQSNGYLPVDDSYSIGGSSIDVDNIEPLDEYETELDQRRRSRGRSLQQQRTPRSSKSSITPPARTSLSRSKSPRESLTTIAIPEDGNLQFLSPQSSTLATLDGSRQSRSSLSNRSTDSGLSGNGSHQRRRHSYQPGDRKSNFADTDSIGSASSIMNRPNSRASKSSGSKSAMVMDPDDEILVGPEKMLHDAARRGELDTIEQLLNDGVDIDCRNQTERTALHLAAGNGHLLVLKLMLDRDANIEAADKFGMTALLWSSWFGHKECVQLLLRAGAKPASRNKNGYTLLHCAAQNNREMIEHILVEDLEDFDKDTTDDVGRTCLHVVAKFGRKDLLERFIDLKCNVNAQDKAGNTPLHLAAKYGFGELVTVLIAGAADTEIENSEGKTPIHLAAEEGKLEAVQSLVDAGADVNAETEEESSPLHLAVIGGHHEVAIALINGGTDVDAGNKHNQTPLHYAVLNRLKSLVQLLILHNADPNVQDARHESPLHLAAENGQPDVTEMLLHSRVNLSLADQRGKTPLDVAARGSFTAIVDMIIKAERHDLHMQALRLHQGQISDDQGSNLIRDKAMNISFKPDNSPETEHIRTLLYKLATKLLKRDEWRKLAFHWGFTDSQVRAIEEQYTGEKSYREHGHRMLLIWLNSCLLHDENPTKSLFEGLVAIQRRDLAESIRSKVNSIATDKQCVIS